MATSPRSLSLRIGRGAPLNISSAKAGAADKRAAAVRAATACKAYLEKGCMVSFGLKTPALHDHWKMPVHVRDGPPV
jgi:hypothetical protein